MKGYKDLNIAQQIDVGVELNRMYNCSYSKRAFHEFLIIMKRDDESIVDNNDFVNILMDVLFIDKDYITVRF